MICDVCQKDCASGATVTNPEGDGSPIFKCKWCLMPRMVRRIERMPESACGEEGVVASIKAAHELVPCMADAEHEVQNWCDQLLKLGLLKNQREANQFEDVITAEN